MFGWGRGERYTHSTVPERAFVCLEFALSNCRIENPHSATERQAVIAELGAVTCLRHRSTRSRGTHGRRSELAIMDARACAKEPLQVPRSIHLHAPLSWQRGATVHRGRAHAPNSRIEKVDSTRETELTMYGVLMKGGVVEIGHFLVLFIYR